MVKNIRIVVVGQKGCGKSTIIGRMLYPERPESFVPSDEDIHLAIIDTDRGTKERVRLLEVNLDPSSDIRQQLEMYRHYWMCEAFVLVIDVTNEESLRTVENLKQAIEKAKEKKEAVFVLIANKTDLVDDRKLESAELQKWAAKEKVKLVESYALDRESLVPHFCSLVSKLVQPQTSPVSAVYPQASLAAGSFRRSFSFISDLLPFQRRRLNMTTTVGNGDVGEKTWIGKSSSGKSTTQDSNLPSK